MRNYEPQYHLTVGLIAYLAAGSATCLAFEPAPIPIGDAELTPQVAVRYFEQNNVYAVNEDSTKSSGVRINPRIAYLADKAENYFLIAYEGEYARYQDVDNLDYDEHVLGMESLLIFSSRARLNIDGQVARRFTAPGTEVLTDSGQIIDDELPEFDTTSLGALFHYGAKSAKGGLELGVERQSKTYSNREDITEGLDWDSLKGTLEFQYRVSNDTRIIFGVEMTEWDYTDTDRIPTLDRSRQYNYVGARWDITGRSTGFVKIGQASTDFTSDERVDENASEAQLGATWSPVKYSRFTLDAQKTFDVESGLLGTQTNVSLSWNHQWNSKISTSFTANHLKKDGVDEIDDRTTDSMRLSLDYSIQRWLAFTTGTSFANNKAALDENDYKQKEYHVGLRVSL